jgi:hypothetical protein
MVWVWAEGYRFWNQKALDPHSKGQALFLFSRRAK